MVCPRCGATTETGPDCPRCGVVLAKARAPRSKPAPPARAAEEASAAGVWLPVLGLAVVVAAGVYWVHRERGAPTPPRRTAESRAPDPRTPPTPFPSEEPPAVSVTVPLPDGSAARAAAIDPGDAAELTRLLQKLQARAPVSASDLRSAERLYAEYPNGVRDLLKAVLLALADQERMARRYGPASDLVGRAIALAPGDAVPRRMRLALDSALADWTAAEASARELLRLAPGDGEATRALAYALLRQDRTREAIEVLSSYLEGREDPEARTLLAQLQHDSAPEAQLTNQTLSHFHVRYDGAAHEDVGREVLRVCERHYATLARTFDHEPAEPIPVVLMSAQSYYESTGAPAWSGGRYTDFDGRVRIPIGGLTTSLPGQLDATVLHELTHAFVADCSRGTAPRELHEGLAQLMEGHHLSEVGEAGMRALADGRLGGPQGFYLFALGWTEDLVAQRGQGGINDLLAAMARSGDVDQGFKEVYGHDLETSKKDWLARLRQQHGS
ncbi:MAG TPA: tetratricopeptide repeat protein [Vicinamibacteria bacterium]|nr:tetratricopeptide repeat protein [Vicinamibacteria bacterium]